MESKVKIITIYNTKGLIEKTFQKKKKVDFSGLKPGVYIIITEYFNELLEKNLLLIK